VQFESFEFLTKNRKAVARPSAVFSTARAPTPLIGKFSNNVLGDFRKALRVFENIPFRVAGFDNSNCRLETQFVLTRSRVPIRIAGDNGRASVQREARDAGCRACSLSKKFDERSFFWQRVLVARMPTMPALLSVFSTTRADSFL